MNDILGPVHSLPEEKSLLHLATELGLDPALYELEEPTPPTGTSSQTNAHFDQPPSPMFE